jgi:hypothetical protein
VADFVVQRSGVVEARLTFASAEPLGGLPLDRDHDGIITAEDIAAARDDLRAFLLQGVEVDADQAACAPTFGDASLAEVDGLMLQASFDCPADAAEIEVVLYYLSALRPGHREVARIVAEGSTVSQVLSGDHRAIALRLRPGDNGAVRKKRATVVAAIAAGVIGIFAWGARRWRAMRDAWQNRAS